jgi:hypothetical protein
MICDYPVKVSDYYDDLGNKVVIDFAHCIQINTLPKRKNGKSFRCIGVCFNIANEYSKVSHGVIAHEAFHFADVVLAHAGIQLSNDSSEAYSYLVEWATDQIYEYFDKLNIPIHLKM